MSGPDPSLFVGMQAPMHPGFAPLPQPSLGLPLPRPGGGTPVDSPGANGLLNAAAMRNAGLPGM